MMLIKAVRDYPVLRYSLRIEGSIHLVNKDVTGPQLNKARCLYLFP